MFQSSEPEGKAIDGQAGDPAFILAERQKDKKKKKEKNSDFIYFCLMLIALIQ